MGWWDYKNIGASASRLNNRHVEKIFEYMGFCSRPDYSEGGDDCSFWKPDVYSCMSSANPYISEQIHWVKALDGYGIKDLRDLLNALFPGTLLYLHSASGNNTSDTWENHDEVYNPNDMTCYGIDKYVDYGGGTFQPDRSWKARFILEPPKMAFVKALIDISTNDGNTELAALLERLVQKLKNKEIVYKEDASDNRKVNKKYDIVKGEGARLELGYRSSSIPRPTVGEISCYDYCEQNKAMVDRYVAELTDLCSSTTIENLINSVLSGLEYRDNNATLKTALDNIDLNAVITFEDKHFVFTGLDGHEEMYLECQVEKRGGIYHRKMVNSCDYLIISLSSPGSEKVNRAVSLKDRGFGIQIITEYQLWKAICDKQFKVMSDEEAKAVIESREQEKKNAEAERIKRKQEQEEVKKKREAERQEQIAERLRIAQEVQEKREIERQQREDAKRKIAEETARKKQEKEKEKEEKERQAIAAREQRELQRQEARASANILYSPGNEPERIQKRLVTLFEKLDDAYPDKRIQGLNKKHKKWGETVTELYRLLGYADSVSFLEAYGYIVVNDGGGRPSSVDPAAIIEELHRRYPNGAGDVNMDYLKGENPDIPWKTLANNAKEYFGTTLVAYLKSIGIIGGTGVVIASAREPVGQKKVDTAPNAHAKETIDGSSTNSTMTEKQQQGVDITSSERKYLSAIEQLAKTNTTVRAVDVASVLGYSSAAVSNAMKKLKEKGLISVAANGAIALQQEGAINGSKNGNTEYDDRTDLTTSEISYLNAIKSLQNENIKVRAVDVATVLGVSRASVSIALKKLREKGIVIANSDGSLSIVDSIGNPVNHSNASDMEDGKEMKATQEVDEWAKREAEEKARREVEEQARREAEEQARREAEEQARREAEEQARREAEEQARREAEEQARREAEEQARREAEEQAQREAEEQARREAEEQARREAEEQARREAEEQARREAEEQARREAEEQARREAEEQACREAEETQRRAMEAQKAAEKARISAEILDLIKELNSLKGLFVGKKRKKIQIRIDELNEQLHGL